VRFARRRFGHYDLVDFAVVLLGYAISGEQTLEAFYESLHPFAAPFMALFGRERLPHRLTLSRFLAALDQAPVEALRTLFLENLLARSLEKEEKTGGLWERQGNQWVIFDVDGTRQAARQRALPVDAFTPADVVALYFHRGAFEAVLADEDEEQDLDRWCSQTAWGQELWQILAQWLWNCRFELGHTLYPTPMRTTEFASAQTDEPVKAVPVSVSQLSDPAPITYGPPQWARPSYTKGFARADFTLQPDRTLRCPAGCPLYPQERRSERDGSLRVLYAARIGHCRACHLREHCQEAATTIKARRVSAVYWPISSPASTSDESPSVPEESSSVPASHPVLWGDWSRRAHRREIVNLLRHQRVDIQREKPALPDQPFQPPPVRRLSRAERAHSGSPGRSAWRAMLV
jgi:hypothetical protein